MTKISIRFLLVRDGNIFDYLEVRAIWDEEQVNWWFSVVDIVGVLNEENDHSKAGN